MRVGPGTWTSGMFFTDLSCMRLVMLRNGLHADLLLYPMGCSWEMMSRSPLEQGLTWPGGEGWYGALFTCTDKLV